MIAGARINVGSLTGQPRRYLSQSLLLSVLLHGLIWVFLVNRDNLGNKVRVVPAQTVRSYLYQMNPPSTSGEAVKRVEAASHKKPVKKVSKGKAAKKKAAPNKVVPSSASINIDLKSSVKDSPSAIDQFLGSMVINCNPTEKQSEIRNCDESRFQPSSRRLPRRFERDLAVLFKPPPIAVAAKFKRDMARVEKLVSELKHLDGMIDSAGEKSEFLLQQQRQLQNEIQLIDSQYDEVNLLKVLGSGIKTLNKGYEAIREKK